MTSATSMARSPSVVLIEQDRDTMVSNWIDAIVGVSSVSTPS